MASTGQSGSIGKDSGSRGWYLWQADFHIGQERFSPATATKIFKAFIYNELEKLVEAELLIV